MKHYPCKCEILSPVHIGTGDEIEPLEYVIQNNRFYKIQSEKWLSQLSENERTMFEKLIDKGDLIQLRHFIADHFDPDRDSIYSAEVSSGVQTIYTDRFDNIENSLRIQPFMRTGTDVRPFIPGSSIKGSIRTAVVSEMAKNSGLEQPRPGKEEYQFESNVLNYQDVKNDPFRAVKIEDAHLRHETTWITEVSNIGKDQHDRLNTISIQMFSEVTWSMLNQKEVCFDMEISIDDALQNKKGTSLSIDIDQIIRSCNAFYQDKLNMDSEFYAQSEIEPYLHMLMNESFDKDSFLLRLGRFSGIYSVTLDEYRNPRPPGGKSWGKTKNVADKKYPLGWVKVNVINK